MGACYSVNLKLGFEREEKKNDAAEAMRKYIETHNEEDVDFALEKWGKLDVSQDTFENLLRIFFGGWVKTSYEYRARGKWVKYCNDFDGSYGWETVMLDIFTIISPFLLDGSEMIVSPDDDYDYLVVKNGKCVADK